MNKALAVSVAVSQVEHTSLEHGLEVSDHRLEAATMKQLLESAVSSVAEFDERERQLADTERRLEVTASAKVAGAALAAYGPSVEAVALAGGAGVAAAIECASLRPRDICAAFVAGLEGTTLADARRLLALARGALDSLVFSSLAGVPEATEFFSSALRGGGLYSLLFRDERAAAETNLCEATVLALERCSGRTALILTRPVKPGELLRTIFRAPDGTPLRSFLLLAEDDDLLIDSIVDAYEAEPVPATIFAVFCDTREAAGGTSAAAAQRAQLGERALAAVSAAFVASNIVLIHNIALSSMPAGCIARLRSHSDKISMTQREFDGLFLSLHQHQLGMAVLMSLAVFATSSPALAALLDSAVDAFARVLAALSGAAPRSEALVEGAIVFILNVCSQGGERFAQALVDQGAFTLLKPIVRHDNVSLAVRTCFAVGAIATSCKGSSEPLQRSGMLDVMANVLRPIAAGSVLVPGYSPSLCPWHFCSFSPTARRPCSLTRCTESAQR